MEVTLTQVNRYTTKKDGSPLITSKGRPYTSVRIKTQEHGDLMISGFGNQDNAQWKAGDKVDITVEQKGEYLNFSMPTQVKNAPSDAIVARLENFITMKMEPMMTRMEAALDRLETLGAKAAGDGPEDWEPQFPDGEKM